MDATSLLTNTALAPKPRVNLTRYHGVLAPNHRWRAAVTSSGGRAIVFEVTSGFAEAAEDEDEAQDSPDSTEPCEGGIGPSAGKGDDA